MSRGKSLVGSLFHFITSVKLALSAFIWFYLQRVFRIALDYVTQKAAGFIFPAQKDNLPPITEPLLLESAFVLAEKIRKGDLKSEDLLKAYIKRAQVVNPIVNAYICSRFEEALEEAREVDSRVQEELASQRPVEGEPSIFAQPLLGIPFTVKDSVAVEGMLLTAGLLSRKGFRSRNDAKVVTNLRDAGAIPIAVTNVSVRT